MDTYTSLALKNLSVSAISYLAEGDSGDACLSLSGVEKNKNELKCLPWNAKPHTHLQADLVPECILLVCSKNPVKVVICSITSKVSGRNESNSPKE